MTVQAAALEQPTNQIGTASWCVLWLLAMVCSRCCCLCRMAPEIHYNWKVAAKKIQLEEGSVYLPSADVYSLTVVVWELVTELQPYTAAKDSVTGRVLAGYELADQIMAGLRPCDCVVFNPDGEDSASKQVQTLIASGWNHVPSKRPTAEDIGIRLREQLETHQVVLQLTTRLDTLESIGDAHVASATGTVQV